MRNEELEQIGDTISAVQAFILRQIVQPYRIPWFRLSGQSARHQKLRRDAEAIALKHIQARRAEGVGDTDLLRILLQATYHDTGKPMASAALLESLQLLVAGNETSSNALTWILYMLARHPEHIVAISEEAAKVIGDAPFTFENLHQLEGTMRVIDEALRLYPPFWMIDRIALQDDEIAGVRIPKGAMVIPYIYGTHRNPATGAMSSRSIRAASSGPEQGTPSVRVYPVRRRPRSASGATWRLMQMLLIIVTFARRYDFKPASDTAVGIQR